MAGGRNFQINPIAPREPQGIVPTGAAQGNFDPLLDLESGLQNVEGLTQEYYDLWAGMRSMLMEQQSLGIDPFDPTSAEGQQMGRTMMKSIGAMKMLGDQLNTGQSIQQAAIPYLATGQMRLAEGANLNEEVTSVQSMSEQSYSTRIDPVVKEINDNFVKGFERQQDLDYATEKLGDTRAEYTRQANDKNATPAERAYAQRQADAVGNAYKNIPQFNPFSYQRQTGMLTPQNLNGITTKWFNIASGRDLNQLYEANKNIIPDTGKINPHMGTLSYDEFRGGKRIRKFVDVSQGNNYGLSDIHNISQQGLNYADQTPTKQLIQNGIDPATYTFTNQEGEAIKFRDDALWEAQDRAITRMVDATMENRMKDSNIYKKRIQNAEGQVAIPPGHDNLGVPVGSIITDIGSQYWWGDKSLTVKAGGKTIEIPIDDSKAFLYDLFKWNYEYFNVKDTFENDDFIKLEDEYIGGDSSTRVNKSTEALDSRYKLYLENKNKPTN